MNLEAKKI